MAKIVAAMAAVHGPRILSAMDLAPPEDVEKVLNGFDTLRRDLEAASPDWVMMITNEHLTNRFFPYLPTFTLGVGPTFYAPAERSTGLGEMGVPSDLSVGEQLLDYAWNNGADLAFSSDIVLDHGSTVPLHFLTPHLDLPIVHIHQLTARGPHAPLRRCYALGGLLRNFIDKRPVSERVAVIATGGLSHWVGNPRMGQVNVAWDSQVLDRFVNRRDEELLAMTTAEIESGGNGAHEIRNWITAAGIVPGAMGEVVSRVEHVPVWAQSSAHLRFHVN